MVLVLTGVAVIMGAILAWVNSVTSGPIADQKEKALADGIKAVMQCDELTVTSTDTVKQPDNKGKELTFVVSWNMLRHRDWVPRPTNGSRPTARAASSD